MTLNAKLLRKFLNLAADMLTGKWLLVGGTLLPAVGLDIRSTMDIDIIGLGSGESQQTLHLMDIAERLGLGVEAINQAASYFLKKIDYKETDLIVLTTGKKATIYRPSLELYWRLKMARLSEADLSDCQHYYDFCLSTKDPVNTAQISSRIKAALKKEMSPAKKARMKTLLALLPTGR